MSVLASIPLALAVGQPGWSTWSRRLRIFLDRAEVERCTAYDIGRGTVTRQKLVDGRPFIDPMTRLPAVETVRGLVEVQWARTARPSRSCRSPGAPSRLTLRSPISCAS